MIRQDHRDALLFGQALHRGFKQIGDLAALDERASIRLLVRDFGHGVDILGARLAPQVDAAVGDDAIEPRRELGAAVLPLTAMGPDLEHGVLHHVLGVGRVADDPQCDRVGTIDVPLDQQAKRDIVTGGETIQKLLVFVEDEAVGDRGTVRHRRG